MTFERDMLVRRQLEGKERKGNRGNFQAFRKESCSGQLTIWTKKGGFLKHFPILRAKQMTGGADRIAKL